MKRIASFLIILAGIIWGTMGIFVNEMESIGFNTAQSSAIRLTGAAIAFVITVFFADSSKFKIHIKDLWLFAVIGIVSVLGMSLLYLYTISKTSLSVAAILLYTSPIWVILISAVFFKEKMTWQKVVALVCAFLGCILVSYTGDESGSIGIWYFIIGLGSGIAYGLYSIFGTIALKKYHSYTVTMYSFLFAASGAWVVAKPQSIIPVMQDYPNKTYMISIMILIGLVTAYITFMLYTIGLKHIAPGKAAIMACSEPLAAAVLGYLVYGQSASITGILLIFFAIMLVNNFGISKK